MKSIKLFAVLLAAAIGLLASTLSAPALDATADTWLNVRPGPGASYAPPVDTLAPGERVTLGECESNGWCYITHSGADGWVNTDYLTPVPGDSPDLSGPDCRFELTLGGGVPRLRIVCGAGGAGGGGGGSGGGGGAPDPEDDAAPNRACFYDGPNFTDESICRSVGTYNNLGAASDRITSVRLYGTAKVRLCERTNMGPFCRDVTTSEGQLGPYLDNKVSSLRVYTGSLPTMKQACFFRNINYGGEHYCLRPGQINNLGGWNNDISSIALFGGAQVRICLEPGMVDPCYPVTTNQTSFLSEIDNDISSLRVH